MLQSLPKHKKLILFDGVCNLCNTSVQFAIKRDTQNIFMFTPLQSKIGKQILLDYNIDASKIDSILLYEHDRGVSYKSTAALRIASKLSFPTKALALFLIVPAFIRHWVYDYIAKNRYKWYGKKESCMIPTPELKAKFIV